MPMLQDDMTKVSAPTDLPAEGWYHVRISKVEVGVSKETNNPVVNLQLKIQDDGPSLGRVIFDNASLQPQALFKLKGYYNACGYKPGPEGHDPEKLIDCECFIYVQHELYQGVTRAKVPPFSIRSLNEGPGTVTPGKK